MQHTVTSTTQAVSDLLAVEAARARIVAAVPVVGAEKIGVAVAAGRVLAEDVVAALSYPPMPLSAMDGYACRAGDVAMLPARLRQIGISRAGFPFAGALEPGTCVRIFTGAVVPAGAVVIALQEDAVEKGGAVEIAEAGKPGQFIRPAGMDFVAGQRCLARGRLLTVRDLGVIASCGHAFVSVSRKPRIAILSTGDELVAPGSPDAGPHRIMASNGAALAAAVTLWGGEAIDLGIVPDEVETIAAAVDRAAGADLLVTTGGASVGDHDLVRAALDTRGFAAEFWKIAMRPGKPLLFGRLGAMPVLAMPGNPVSALVCALLFLRPAMAAMCGMAAVGPRFARAILASRLPENDRREDYVRARLHVGDDGRLLAEPYRKQDSGMAFTFAQADALIRRAPFAPAAAAGEPVDIIEFASACGY